MQLSLFKRGNAGERCLRRQCEISIGCDEGRFISPEECALAPSFSRKEVQLYAAECRTPPSQRFACATSSSRGGVLKKHYAM